MKTFLVWALLGMGTMPWLNQAAGALKVAELKRPATFPHRIWAACDFEGQTHPDYAWFGKPETNSTPRYPGNRTSLRANPGAYGTHAAIMAGMNPVPGPRMGKENWLFLRYSITGGSTATLQHFSLTSEDNWHVNVEGLKTAEWAELAVNFSGNAKRNDGRAIGFREGERMDDFKMFAGMPEEANRYELMLDDVMLFSFDPEMPPEPEPFPQRVIFLAAFDTGEKDKYWPGDFRIAENPPPGAYWRAAQSVSKPGGGQMITLSLQPPRPVGSRTKLRFRYHISGATEMVVQIFDATVQDNRHVVLRDLPQEKWVTQYVDFTQDGKRNDGTANSTFSPGNLVDDIFFFVSAKGDKPITLYVDEVVLFDAGLK